MTDKIRLIALVLVFIFISLFVYNYYNMKSENKDLKKNIETVKGELATAVSVNKTNSDMYNKELDRIRQQIADINKLNSEYEEKNESVKENIKVIDSKIKDKTKEEKNKILKQELNNIINIINEKEK